ncbi:Cation-independent mannose-6-phosphate receptor CI-MPR [Coemansia sp. RSA 486]|nr:Cation-independent mannose-6-phosphate receptor CI-MPR [Coemansia sp. RSA 486]KAJ2232086.1 Cation-independent mannose-6-phosphate receptor CI-MPR [Coemansia sp. RSA 485]
MHSPLTSYMVWTSSNILLIATLLLAFHSSALTTLAATIPSAAPTEQCTAVDSTKTLFYDIRPLQHNIPHNDGYTIEWPETGYTFNLAICQPLPEHDNNQWHTAARWQRDGKHGILGKAGSSKLFVRGNKLLLEYSDGDACPGNPQLNQSALISFICDQHMDKNDMGMPAFVSEWHQCAFMFEWRTPVACPQYYNGDDHVADRDDNDDGSDSPSHGSVAFVVVFVVGSIYILGGVLYNRVLNSTSGLRGLEQLPNYRFWRAIVVFFRDAALAAADGVVLLVNKLRGRRRNAIRIDEVEHSFRREIFDSDSDDEDALPISHR